MWSTSSIASAESSSTSNLGAVAFFTNTIIQDAVVRNLQIIGESSKRVSEALQKATPAIPWKSILGLRNVLVHGYLGVDLERIWDIVSSDLGALRHALDAVLEADAASPRDGDGESSSHDQE